MNAPEPPTHTHSHPILQVSEGMDFADHRARAVVVTGIPFAPAKDPKARFVPVDRSCRVWCFLMGQTWVCG